jgi:hypothetical protein
MDLMRLVVVIVNDVSVKFAMVVIGVAVVMMVAILMWYGVMSNEMEHIERANMREDFVMKVDVKGIMRIIIVWVDLVMEWSTQEEIQEDGRRILDLAAMQVHQVLVGMTKVWTVRRNLGHTGRRTLGKT